jgi:YfiH family protein
MSVTDLGIPATFLYQTQLGGVATVSVSHNMGCLENTYAGNLGLHVNDNAAAVLERRAALEAALGLSIQWLNQVHGVAVCTVQNVIETAPTADAAITRSAGTALAIMTADCLPVVFSASNAAGNHAIAAAHAGWRGLLNGVLAETVSALHSQIPNATLHAHLGPCIGLGQFEVGGEVRDAFMASTHAAGKHFTLKSNGKYLCDLESLARDALVALGVQTISGGGWCTVSDSRLASYRRQAVTGRFATLVALN